jgi:hypothetical protein
MSIASEILDVTKVVLKEWTAQRKAEQRGRPRSSRDYVYSDRVYFTDVMDAILPGAYAHASGGKYSVSKRHLYYNCRDEFCRRTGRKLQYPYFAGTLLVQYLNRHPELGWKLTADARGTAVIPNAGHPVRIPVGTIQIDNHLRNARRARDP